MPALTILIVSYNTADLLVGCLRSLGRVADEVDFEIVVVDNASPDGSAARVRTEFPSVTVVESPRNVGFAAGMNLGLAAARGALVLGLNPDCLVPRETLLKLTRFMSDHPRSVIAGAGLTAANGRDLKSTFRPPSLFREFWNLLPELKSAVIGFVVRPMRWIGGRRCIIGDPVEVDAVSGAALIMRSEAIREVGGFDEGFFLYHEELDLCARVRKAGWAVWSIPGAQVIHFDAQASGYRTDRLTEQPVLGWRLCGMDRLWAKHRPGLAHRLWRWQTCGLLTMRIWAIRLGGLLGYGTSERRGRRIRELFTVRERLRMGGATE